MVAAIEWAWAAMGSDRRGRAARAARLAAFVAALALLASCGGGQGIGSDVGLPTRGNSPWVKMDTEPQTINNFGVQCIVFPAGRNQVVSEPFVIGNSSGFLLFYVLREEKSGEAEETVAAASSADGIAWGKGSIVLRATQGWEGGRVGAPSVVRLDDGELALWYEGEGGIGLARSRDGGKHWEKDPGGQPVLAPSDPWEEGRIASPAVVLDSDALQNERFRMWYEGAEGGGIGSATSPDGVHWTKLSAAAPVVPRGEPGAWDEASVGTPAADIDVTEGRKRFLVWYTGLAQNDFGIGFAGSFDGTAWTKYRHNPVLNEFPPLSGKVPVAEQEPTLLRVGLGRWMWYTQKQSLPPEQGFCLATQAAASP